MNDYIKETQEGWCIVDVENKHLGLLENTLFQTKTQAERQLKHYSGSSIVVYVKRSILAEIIENDQVT